MISRFAAPYDLSLSVIIRSGRTTFPFEKLSHQPFYSRGTAVALHQHVENNTILIDGAPQPMFLAANGDDVLIEVPHVAKPTGRSPADFAGKVPAELLRPETHGLVRDDDSTRRKQIFDHPQAERKTKIAPNGVGNHFRRKPVAAIQGIWSGLHHAARSHRSIADRLTLRCHGEQETESRPGRVSRSGGIYKEEFDMGMYF